MQSTIKTSITMTVYSTISIRIRKKIKCISLQQISELESIAPTLLSTWNRDGVLGRALVSSDSFEQTYLSGTLRKCTRPTFRATAPWSWRQKANYSHLCCCFCGLGGKEDKRDYPFTKQQPDYFFLNIPCQYEYMGRRSNRPVMAYGWSATVTFPSSTRCCQRGNKGSKELIFCIPLLIKVLVASPVVAFGDTVLFSRNVVYINVEVVMDKVSKQYSYETRLEMFFSVVIYACRLITEYFSSKWGENILECFLKFNVHLRFECIETDGK